MFLYAFSYVLSYTQVKKRGKQIWLARDLAHHIATDEQAIAPTVSVYSLQKVTFVTLEFV